MSGIENRSNSNARIFFLGLNRLANGKAISLGVGLLLFDLLSPRVGETLEEQGPDRGRRNPEV